MTWTTHRSPQQIPQAADITGASGWLRHATRPVETSLPPIASQKPIARERLVDGERGRMAKITYVEHNGIEYAVDVKTGSLVMRRR